MDETEKVDPGNLREMEVSFGVARRKDTGQIRTCAKVIVEGKSYLGIGDTRQEALQDALKQHYPELKEMRLGPQIAWNPLVSDLDEPVTMDEVDGEWKSAKEIIRRD